VNEQELQPHERAVLCAWADLEVTDDFADEVLARWEAEQEPALAPADDELAELPAPTRTVTSARRDRNTAWWCGIAAAAAAVALALGLAVTDPGGVVVESVAPEPGPELIALRVAAEGTLLARCTPCHLGGAEGAKAEALAVFDLGDPRWGAALSPEQLADAAQRIVERGDPSEAVGFRRYVDAELAHRGSAAR
jgi:hypothetical protein